MTLVLIVLLPVVASLIVVWYMRRDRKRTLKHTISLLDKFADGSALNLDESKAQMDPALIRSFQHLAESLHDKAEFADEIARGNFNVEFKQNHQDTLDNSLINMRNQLLANKEEDRKRSWATEGLAKFSELLRKDQTASADFANDLLVFIIRYVKANQGSLFIVNEMNEKEPFLELMAAYAWDRKKHIQKRIPWGEGLAGQAWQEKEYIYLKKVPGDFVRITSGLGEANPRSVIVIPLNLNATVYGILELASFQDFELYQIHFLEQLAESIASTISAIRINAQTRQLLEESKIQEEAMRAQEEEMKQNMEELQAIQEQMKRREAEIVIEFEALHKDYKKKIHEIEERESALHDSKRAMEKALNIDGLLVDIAGRNRYVSQRIVLLCQLVYHGKGQVREELKLLTSVHDDSLKKIRYGGVPLCCEKQIAILPASEDLVKVVTRVEDFWMTFKKCIEQILEEKENGADRPISALNFIENNSERLLRLNNELVQASIRSQGRQISNDTYPLTKGA